MATYTGTSGNDAVSYGGNSNDHMSGGADNDSLNAGDGQDIVYGGTGNDLLDLGDGNDTGTGGADDDTVYGGAGDDAISGDAGADLLYGGTGNDTVTGGSGADTVYGAEGNDQISAGSGDDLAFGGAGNDLVVGDAGNDTLSGDAGNDTLTGGAGHDAIYGGDGDDVLRGDDGNDQLFGGAGNDTLTGGAGIDALAGGAGNDALSGGTGNDTLRGGAGDDTLAGGAGDDRFVFERRGGHDAIADFDITLHGGHTADQLDVGDLTHPDSSPVRAWDVVATDDGHGNALLTFPMRESVVLQGVAAKTFANSDLLSAMGVPCFVAGTQIATPHGERPVQDIAAGDLVLTAAGHAVPVIWRGHQDLCSADLARHPSLARIRFAPGAIGNQAPLFLSPQHAVCLPGLQAGLIRARHCAEFGAGARATTGIRQVRYHHLMLARHDLLLAEGTRVESFYPGPMAMTAVAGKDRREVITAIIGLPHGGSQHAAALERYGPRCQAVLTRRAARAELADLFGAQATLLPPRPKPAALLVARSGQPLQLAAC